MSWHWLLITFLSGFALGWILCDVATIERKVEVNIKKQKIKGEGNTLEAVTDIEVQEKKQDKKLFNWFKRRKLRKNKPE